MKKIAVLGVGLVGRAMVLDLVGDYQVVAVDRDEQALSELAGVSEVTTTVADFSDFDRIGEIVADCDLVVGAVPGFLGYATLENLIKRKKNVVDISFFPEDAFALDQLACDHDVTAVVDCGVAPGMSHLLLGYHYHQMEEVEHFSCMVGGLPRIRTWPFQYKAPFSPIDVIEEYTRPARLVEDGRVVIKPALSDREFVHFPEVGTLEGFNTDGLRSLLKTVEIPHMVEKTLRYPGHVDAILLLKEAGFFSNQELSLGEVAVKPIDFTSRILFDQWKLQPGEREFTLMEIAIRGKKDDRLQEVRYRLFDETDSETGRSSMARTTGYTGTAVARLVVEGKFNRKGICPPEYIGENRECTEGVLKDLEERGVYYRREVRFI